jgi:hypothetical protein
VEIEGERGQPSLYAPRRKRIPVRTHVDKVRTAKTVTK